MSIGAALVAAVDRTVGAAIGAPPNVGLGAASATASKTMMADTAEAHSKAARPVRAPRQYLLIASPIVRFFPQRSDTRPYFAERLGNDFFRVNAIA